MIYYEFDGYFYETIKYKKSIYNYFVVNFKCRFFDDILSTLFLLKNEQLTTICGNIAII